MILVTEFPSAPTGDMELLHMAACEVVHMMFVDKLKKEAAVNNVMVKPQFRGIFGNSGQVLELVDKLFEIRPDLGQHVEWQSNGVPRLKKEKRAWTQAAITHDQMTH